MTPDASRDEHLRLLTARFGEFYRVWESAGTWWARSQDGDLLSASDAPGLELVLLDHVTLLRGA